MKLKFTLENGTILEVPEMKGATFNLARYQAMQRALAQKKAKAAPPPN